MRLHSKDVISLGARRPSNTPYTTLKELSSHFCNLRIGGYIEHTDSYSNIRSKQTVLDADNGGLQYFNIIRLTTSAPYYLPADSERFVFQEPIK